MSFFDSVSIENVKLWTLNVSAFFAASINFILILLIVTKSPKSVGTYKYLMIYIAFVEFAYAVLYVAEKPDIFTKGSAFLIITNTKESIFPRIFSIGLDKLFVGFYGLTISLLAVHFIYRYLAISKNTLLETFENWKIILWFLYPLVNGAIWFYSFVIFAATEDSDRFVKKTYFLTKNNGTRFEDLYYGGPFYYLTNANGNEYINWRAFEGSAVIMSLIIFSFSTMIYFGVKGFKTMQQLMGTSSISEKYKNLQSQLFNALLLQTLIPFFLMHIPATIVHISIFLNCSTEIFGEVLNISIAMYPAFNPLPTIFIVKSYRTAVAEIVCCRKQVIPSDNTLSRLNSQMMTHHPPVASSTTASTLLESFENWKIILWFLYPILNGAIWLYSAIVIFASTEDSDRFLKKTYFLTKKNDTKFEDIYYGGPFYYLTNQYGMEYINWRAFEGSLIVVSLIILSFSTMIYFGVKGYKTMQRLLGTSSISEKYKSLQSQLFNALLLQTLIPFFLMHIPASIVYISVIFNFSTEILGEILNISIAMYPAFNPLPTIFIVKSYRTAVAEIVCCRTQVIVSNDTLSGLNSRMMTQHPTINTTAIN